MKKEHLSSEQFILLSWLATMNFNKRFDPKEPERPYKTGNRHGVIRGIEIACNVLNIPFNDVYDISINGNFAGYQNMNKLTEIKHF